MIVEGVLRSEVADLSALLGFELVAAAERSALVRFLRLSEYGTDVRVILENPIRRKAVIAAGDYRGSTLVISLPKRSPRDKRRLRFRLSIYNDGADFAEEKRLMEDFSDRETGTNGGRLLGDSLGSGSGVYGDDGLCFYYLGILSEECRRQSIVLDAHLREASPGGSVVTTLAFGL